LFQGRIVYVRKPIPDPQGSNPKENRPFVVITPNHQIAGGAPVELVAVATDRGRSDPATDVELNHGAGSRNLPSPSVAVCHWRIWEDDTQFDISQKHANATRLEAVLQKVEELKAIGR
jgi:mRNA-degrading endonuclease toxin of MazEF toxin-antitoxin module